VDIARYLVTATAVIAISSLNQMSAAQHEPPSDVHAPGRASTPKPNAAMATPQSAAISDAIAFRLFLIAASPQPNASIDEKARRRAVKPDSWIPS